MDDWFDGLDFDTGDSFDTDWFADSGFEVDDIDMGDYDTGYDWDISGGDDGTSWWNALNGNNSSGTNWMNMLLGGASSYLSNQSASREANRNREHDIALTILRDQLNNKEYDRRQQQLKDAYKGYEQYAGNTPNDMSGLSAYKPQSLLQGSNYYGY